MFSLEDYSWLASPSGWAAWESLLTSVHGTPSNRMNTHPVLTAGAIASSQGLSEIQARLLLEQWRIAQGAAKRKFSDPTRWFWTQQLIEQSSDESTADETARDFPTDVGVVDGCCGAGADSIAIARHSHCELSIDSSEIACQLVQANGARHGHRIDSSCQTIESWPGSTAVYLNLDPDRRSTGTRTVQLDRMSPPWETIASLISRCRGVSLKLAPGLRPSIETHWDQSERPQCIRWLSRGGSVRQQRWYWNVERWPAEHYIVSVETKHRQWIHELFPFVESSQPPIAVQPSPKSIGAYVADHDPALRAADVTHRLAKRLGVHCIGNATGYFHADHPIEHPMLRCYRVLDSMPLDRKKLKAYARQNPPRCWELKSRNVDIDLDRFRKELFTTPESDVHRSVLFTRFGERHVAIIAEPLENHARDPA
jgi:hypothetical protein